MATTTTTVTEEPNNADDDASSPPSPTTSPPPNNKKKVTYELAARNIYYAKPAAAPRSLVAHLLKPCGASPAPPDYILRDVSLTARAGEILAVVGPSGAGKSTLVDILATRTTPTQGRLLLNGAPLRSTSKSGYARSLAPDPATMFGDSDGSKDASAAAPGPTRRSRPSPTYFCRRHRRSCYCCGSRWKGGEAPEGEKEVGDADGNSFKS